LEIDTTRTTADAWASYMTTYEAALSIKQLNAEKVLRAITLDESRDFIAYITLL